MPPPLAIHLHRTLSYHSCHVGIDTWDRGTSSSHFSLTSWWLHIISPDMNRHCPPGTFRWGAVSFLESLSASGGPTLPTAALAVSASRPHLLTWALALGFRELSL